MKLTITQIKEIRKSEEQEVNNRSKQWLKHNRQIKIKEIELLQKQITIINEKIKEMR